LNILNIRVDIYTYTYGIYMYIYIYVHAYMGIYLYIHIWYMLNGYEGGIDPKKKKVFCVCVGLF